MSPYQTKNCQINPKKFEFLLIFSCHIIKLIFNFFQRFSTQNFHKILCFLIAQTWSIFELEKYAFL